MFTLFLVFALGRCRYQTIHRGVRKNPRDPCSVFWYTIESPCRQTKYITQPHAGKTSSMNIFFALRSSPSYEKASERKKIRYRLSHSDGIIRYRYRTGMQLYADDRICKCRTNADREAGRLSVAKYFLYSLRGLSIVYKFLYF